jgi:hypothetical protein
LKNSSGAVTHAGRLRYWPGMTDFKLWGSTLVIAAVVAGCGDTTNFVGTTPDEGGAGGTKTSGGASSAGSTSKAGAASNAGSSVGGSAGGGSSTGGSVANGGTAGSMANGGFAGTIIDPPGPGCTKLSGNWMSCEDGIVHRTEPGKCDSKLPRAAAIPPTAADLDECTKDSQCTTKPNGYCGVSQGGFVQTKPHNICVYGCLQDAECNDGSICECGGLIGACTSAPACKSDKDCAGGMLCTQYDSCPGIPEVSFACQDPADRCITDADCTDPNMQFCSVGQTQHRECVGVRCAASAGQQ